MSAAHDLLSHYRNIRARLGHKAPQAPVVVCLPSPTFRLVYSQPIGPEPHQAPKPAKREVLRVVSASLVECTLTDPVPRRIAEEVCIKHERSWHDITSRTRIKGATRCRHEIMYRLRKETGLSLKLIGEALGRVNHTTVIHGIRTHAEREGLPA